MKHLLVLLLTFSLFTNAYSQPPGGGGGGGGGGKKGGNSSQNGGPQQSKPAERKMELVNINEVAGLLTYDVAVVLKETKVKKEADKALMTQFITDYNHKIVQIQKDNKVKLETIELTTRVKQQEAIDSKDHEKLMEIGKKIRAELNPIKMETMDAEKELNAKIETNLSAKINKKWMAYFEEQKEALQPQQPKNNSSSDSNSRPSPQSGPR